jgi:Alpha galactosidase A/Alpha galactosidase C-terminal beta sandwich domain
MMSRSVRACSHILFAVSLATSAAAQSAAPAKPVIPQKGDIDYYNGLALTPTMGFSTWNGYGCPWITEDLIKATARAMVSNGMRDAGYVFVNLDDCWQAGRDSVGLARNHVGRVNGHMIADPVWFPSGMKALGDYIHSLGLKFGLYSTHGSSTCQNVMADFGYEVTDAQDYASWGVDFFKIDTCNGGLPGDPNAFYNRYKVLTDALLATGRNIVVEICDFTRAGQAWLWAPQLGNNWRTTGDINGTYMSMRNNVIADQAYREFAGPGHFNNADMMEIGNAGHDATNSGGYSSLAAPVAIGDTVLQVTSPMTQHNIVGAPIRIGSVWNSSANRPGTGNVESGIVATRGTPAGAPVNLFTAAAAGEQNVKVDSTTGMAAGSALLVESVKGGGPSFTYPVTGAPLSGSGFNFPFGPYPLPTGAFESPIITAVGTPGVSTTLADAVAPGAKTIKVVSVAGLSAGDTLTIEQGAVLDRATIAAVGTPAGAVQTVIAPTATGATNIKVSNVGGFVVGEPLVIDAGAKSERATVTAVGTAAGPATTSVAPAAIGEKVVKLAAIVGLAPGDQIAIDSGAKAEIATIASVGTAAGAATTMVAPAEIGTANVKVAAITGFAVGEQLSIVESGAIPFGAVTEAATITKIGTAAGPVTQTVTTAPAGATNIRVASINGFVVGEPLQIMEFGGRSFETATVRAIGTAAGPVTAVAKTSAAGDRAICVASIAGFVAGEQLVAGVGRRQEVRTVASVGTAGADGTGVTVSEPFAFVHPGLDRIRGTGTGIEVTKLAKVHYSGSAARGQGTGIDVTPLKMAHDLGKTGTGQGQGQSPGAGKSIRGTGTGVTLTAPLQKAHEGFVAVRTAGTGITVTPLSAAHADGVEIRGAGTGVTLSSALTHAHAGGAVVRDQSKPGTGITLDRPLRAAHEMNAVVRGAGTGITLTKPVTQAHPLGEQVGGSGMTVDEARTHMSLWAMVTSPLVIGADIPNMAKENLEIYLNRDVIAIDQDPLGIQAFTVSNADNHWIFRKPLANGDVAVAFWNDTTTPWLGATATFPQLTLDPTAAYNAKDLWSKATSTLTAGTVTIGPVPEHGTVILRITKSR